MKVARVWGVGVCLLCWMWLLPAIAGQGAPAVGEPLPQLSLNRPVSTEHQAYLGVAGKASFAVSQIEAEVLIIEVFNMYWPYCQKEAPSVNELFRLVESDERLRGRVKLIGIGAGNSPYEVAFFQQHFNIPFPLFADQDFKLHQRLGEVRTPYFIGARIEADGTVRVFYSKLGGTGSGAKLMENILKDSGL